MGNESAIEWTEFYDPLKWKERKIFTCSWADGPGQIDSKELMKNE